MLNKNDKLRVGIAGYGLVGKKRRAIVDQHPHLKTAAVCDRHFENTGMLTDGPSPVKHFTNYKDLLKEDLDILFVCLTNDVNAEATIAGLEKNLHVFCEKPPSRNMEELSEVVKSAKKKPNLKLKYGFNHRYHDSVKDALKIIQTKELGKLINLRGVYGKSKFLNFGSSEWRTKRAIAGGGILLDQGIHMVDMMRLFVRDSGAEFSEIHSFISNQFWNHDVEDNAYALMRTETGVVAMLHSSATQWRHRFNLEVTLEKGQIVLSGILSGTKSYGAETITVAYASVLDQGDPVEKTVRYNNDLSWKEEVDEFAHCILENKPVLHGTAQDALKTMHLVYRIYCADKEWKNKFKLSDELPKDGN
jgi:predicted dehydrogenase